MRIRTRLLRDTCPHILWQVLSGVWVYAALTEKWRRVGGDPPPPSNDLDLWYVVLIGGLAGAFVLLVVCFLGAVYSHLVS